MNHWKLKRYKIKFLRLFKVTTLDQDLHQIIINEAVVNSVDSSSPEYRKLISRISSQINSGKKVVTVIQGELVEIGKDGDRVYISKVRPAITQM